MTRLIRNIIRVSGLLTIIIGCLVLAGWYFDIAVFKRVMPKIASMKINTSVCLTLAGIALFAHSYKDKKYTRAVFIISSALIILIALATLSEYLFHIDAGIDQLLIRDTESVARGLPNPGRISTSASFCFFFLGSAFIMTLSQKRKIQLAAQVIFHFVSLVAFIAVVGYLYDVPMLYKLSFVNSMAIQTSVLLLFVSVGASFIHPDLAITGLFTGNNTGNIMARRMFPLMVLILVILGYARILSHRWNLVTVEFGITLFMISFLLMGLFLIWTTAGTLNRLDLKKRQSDDLLGAAETNYREIFDKASDAIYVHEMETGKIIQVNQMACDITGFTRQEILSNENDVFITDNPEYSLQDAQEYMQKAAEGEPQLFEWLGKVKDGSACWFEVSLKKATIAGQPRILAFFRDINARKIAEEKMASIEKQLHHTMDNMLEGAQIIGFDWRYKYVNDSFLKHAKYSRDELLGHTVMEKYPGIEHTAIYNVYQRCFNERIAIHLENDFTFPDGSQGCFELSFQPVPEGIFILSVDISERKQAERELLKVNQALKKRTAELESSNTELERFAYVASHDLQEPLRMVSSFLNLLEEDMGDDLSETAKEYIRFSVDGSKRMKELVNDLLHYSRVGTNKEEFKAIDLNETIDYTLRVLDGDIQKHDAVVKVMLMPVVKANKTLIGQLFINLVGNALKYHSEKRPEIEIGYTEEPQHYVFFVKDNGIGIDPKFFDKIFVIFQRLHSKAEYSGTGIGLAICKKIVEVHRGDIWVESEKGKGSTFYFSILKDEL